MSEGRVDNTVREVAVPAESRLPGLFAHVDLADAYAAPLPPQASTHPEQLARFILGNQAPWVNVLMGLRDAMVAGFGLKTARQLKQSDGSPDDRRVHIFKIYESNDREILLGEDDAHLDFRISVLCRPGEVVVSTVVCCHNRLGRNYIRLIKPFHRVIVRDSLQRAVASGWPLAAQEPEAGARLQPLDTRVTSA